MSTQEEFARRFGFSVAALRHWERGKRQPRGPALTLLNVINSNPRAVAVALKQSATFCPFCLGLVGRRTTVAKAISLMANWLTPGEH